MSTSIPELPQWSYPAFESVLIADSWQIFQSLMVTEIITADGDWTELILCDHTGLSFVLHPRE